ncbi:TniQ family protein [Micromonospora olivasterospora]|uniref:TniQ protein n=1 Tax=Micromonospora olivasterospora TaxID=1880 RepID=A0A562IGW2_MICOL|nr:TniQ family protein [Micromonospora olivasterospora]TWH70247.1 TniQ protein [Micromonospora olivasterospora]
MRFWQQPAQQLPIRVRPVRGETLISYVFRLADANDLDRPTILLGALGRPTIGLTRYLLGKDYDVALNEHSRRRLETFTGIPIARLKASLPSLHHTHDALPVDIPAIHPYRTWNLRDHCDHCVSRIPGRPRIRVHSPSFPHLCRRHRRWLAPGMAQVTRQVDLTNTPEIIRADRRYGRLRATTRDHEWTREQFTQAIWIVMDWARSSHSASPRLHARWTARADALRTFHGPFNPSPLLVFPETIALTEILCDLEWRRHVAMVNSDIDMTNFYRHITHRLGQPRTFADQLSRPRLVLDRHRLRSVTNPLQQWIIQHRHKHLQTRTKFWDRHRTGYATRTPFPEIRLL